MTFFVLRWRRRLLVSLYFSNQQFEPGAITFEQHLFYVFLKALIDASTTIISDVLHSTDVP